jgi:hypothetical protein
MLKFFKKNWKYLLLALFFLLSCIVPKIIDLLFLDGYHQSVSPNTMLSAGDWVAYFGSFLTFVGTTILGITTLLQNKSLHERNIEIELNNKRIQLLNAQEMVPFLSFNGVESTNTIFSPKSVLRKFNCIDKSSFNDYTINKIYIYLPNNNETERSLVEIHFSLSNKSKAMINEIIVNSVSLLRSDPQSKKNQMNLFSNVIDSKFNSIKQFIQPGQNVYFILEIASDNDFIDIVNNHLLSFKIELDIVILTGLHITESIEVFKMGDNTLPITYSFENLPWEKATS